MFLNEELKELKYLSQEELHQVVDAFVNDNLETYDTLIGFKNLRPRTLDLHLIYRVPPRKTKIDWSCFDKKYRFFAIQENKCPLLFTGKPYVVGDGDDAHWRFNGSVHVLNDLLSDKVLQIGDEPWQESLIERPEGE